MKETTKMSRAVAQLEKIYNALNSDFWNGELPTPIITVQSKPGTYGHCTTAKVWQRKDEETFELNISAETLSSNIEEICDTIIHEQIHLYCRLHGIQETSRKGTYHNKLFKKLAEAHGLICYRTEKYGWNTTAENNDKLIEYCLEKGWSEIKIERKTPLIPLIPLAGAGASSVQTGGKAPGSSRKYQCPLCRNSVRATKQVNVICGDCLAPHAGGIKIVGLSQNSFSQKLSQ